MRIFEQGGDMEKSRRSLTNFIKTARLSKRYHVSLLFGSLIFVALMTFYFAHTVTGVAARVSALSGQNELNVLSIYSDLNSLFLIFVASMLVYLLWVFIFVIRMEQRISGPNLAILKVIEEIKNGNYDHRRKLRKADELQDIMAALEDLAVSLKRR